MTDVLSMVDNFQITKYRKMLGLTNINSSDTLVELIQSATIMSVLNIENNIINDNNVTINNNLDVSSDLICNKHITSRGYLQSNNIEINNPVTCTDIKSNNIIIDGSINLYNNGLVNKMIIESGSTNDIAYFNNSIIVNNVIQNKTSINIISDNINIGNINSVINFNGSELNFNANETKIYDNILVLNDSLIYDINNESIGIDNGEDAGFIIKSNMMDGYVLLNDVGTRFKIKAPKDNDYRYIATTDKYNNFDIPGNTVLYGASTIMGNLILNNDTTITGKLDFNSYLILSGNTLFHNVDMLDKMSLDGDIIINNKITLMSNLNIFGNAIFNETTIRSNFDITGEGLIYGNLTCNAIINVSNVSLFQGSSTIYGNLDIKNNLLVSGETTIMSNINILNDCIIYGNTSINNNLTISNKSTMNGDATLLSKLNVTGDVIVNNNMTIGSLIGLSTGFDSYEPGDLNNIEIFGKLIGSFKEYENNRAATDAGLPLWCLYRTGGILKVRLDNTPPTIILNNDNDLYVIINNELTISGAYALDNVNYDVPVYIYSIHNNTGTNYITTPYLVTDNLIISDIKDLDLGKYYINYSAVDSEGNETTIERILYVIPDGTSYSYSVNTIELSNTVAYNINNTNLITTQNFTDISFTFKRTLIENIDFNNAWSVIVKTKVLSWGNIDDVFQINFDPSLNDWDTRVKNRENIGLSNISFKYGSKYFYTTDSYWSSIKYNEVFFNKINNTGIYIKIYKNNDQYVGITIYDIDGNEIENILSTNPIEYITKQSFCSFTSFVELDWYYGFVIHKTDAGADVSEFKNIFEN